MSLVEFEKQKVVKSFMNNLDVYYTNLGGYHYSKDRSPCYYLNGMLTMFEEQQKKIDLLEKELTETQAFLNKQNHIKQTKIDELQARVDGALIEMKNQLGDEDFYDMERPDYDAMLYALRNIKDILKGNKDEN